jgi:hypothetical protein
MRIPVRIAVPSLDLGRRSQQGAVRNAMLAATVLADRRLDRLEVEEYVARAAAAWHTRHAPEAVG